MNKRAVRPERLLWSMVAMAITAPVWAHHSFAGYDTSKTVSAAATLKEFRWSSPHSAAVFTVKGPSGKSADMTVASASPSMFVRQGFKPKDFQIGDKMEISWHPAKNGKLGGHLTSVKFPNGRVFNDSEVAPGLKQSDVLKQVESAQ